MQTEVPTLPVVHLNVHENVDRKQNRNTNNTKESKNYSLCRSTCTSSNKKCLHPLLGGSYKNSMRIYSTAASTVPTNKNTLAQRVVSAKMLRIKQLQNQLADAHYHLNELANENRLLKALQKRQDSALRRYEGTTAELPKLINSHHEELRILQIKHKKLRALHKETCNLLKEKENELYSLQNGKLQTQNKHLLQLSKDRNLGEREKLQMQVCDLNNKVMQQQESIQLFQRKLALESKSLKHQLHVEVSKHKQTQKNLLEALEKIKDLENLIDNRTKKQLVIDNKDKILGTQSLTNLRSVSTTVSTTNKCKKYNDTQKDNLPELKTSRLNNDVINGAENSTHASQQTDLSCSEAITSSRQNRKFNSQKVSQHTRSPLFDALTPTFRDTGSKFNENIQNTSFYENDKKSHKSLYHNTESRDKCTTDENSYKVFKEHVQFDQFSNYTDSENGNNEQKSRDYYMTNTIQNSHDLYTRMINSTNHEFTFYTTDPQENEENEQLSSKQIISNENYKEQFRTLQQQDFDHRYKLEADQEEPSGDGFFIEFKNDKFDKIYSDSCSEDFITNDIENETKMNDVGVKMLKTGQRINTKNSGITLQNEENVDHSMQNELNGLEYNIDHMHIQDEENRMIDDQESLITDSKFESHHIYNDNKSKTSTTLRHNELRDIEEYTTVHFEPEKEMEHPEIGTSYLSTHDDNSYSADNMKDKLQHNSYAEQHMLTSIITENQEKILGTDKFEVTDKLTNSVNTISQMDKRKKSLSNTNTSHHNDKSNMEENTYKSKSTSFNKEKLLATMKAIDNNEDINLFIGQQFPRHNSLTRFQITENLFRGLPAHTKKNYDIINDVFDNSNVDNKISLT